MRETAVRQGERSCGAGNCARRAGPYDLRDGFSAPPDGAGISDCASDHPDRRRLARMD